MTEEITTSKVSRYNSAELLNLSLHALWQEARNHARKGDYNAWKNDLDMLWGELGSDVDENSAEEKEFLKKDKDISDLSAFSSPVIKGFSKLNEEQVKKRIVLYHKLRDLHIWLKRLQNKTGKGTAYKDPDEDDFD